MAHARAPSTPRGIACCRFIGPSFCAWRAEAWCFGACRKAARGSRGARCTGAMVHGADVACPRAMPALPMRGGRCRGGLRAAHAMQAPAQVACVRPCPARHASAREALARSPGRMPRRPQPMRRGRLAACHDAPAHARRGSAGRCARGLAMSSGRGRLAMARPARPVRAHGAADVGRVRLSARPRPWARHRPRHVVGHHSDPERQRNRSEIL